VLAYFQYRNYYQIRGDRSPSYIFEAISGILEPLVAKNGDGRGGQPPRASAAN
jgi:hypothetical protein